MKFLIIAIFLAILASLASGLYFLKNDSRGSTRLLKALKIRVALSVALIVLLVVFYYAGWIVPNSTSM